MSPCPTRVCALSGRDSAPAPDPPSREPAILPVHGAAVGFDLSLALAGRQYGGGDEALLAPGISPFGQTVEANIPTPDLAPDRYRDSSLCEGRECDRPRRMAPVA